MGRPPSNGGPSFRFTQPEIAEMESILQAHKTAMPERQILVNLSEKFSNSEERKGKIEVQMKQVWNWFQNRRYAIRAKAAKYPGKLDVTQVPRDNPAPMVKGASQPPPAPPPAAATSAAATVRTFPQPPQQPTVPSAAVKTFPQAPPHPAFSVQNAGRITDNSQMEYEAKSARDGAWYDVSTFLSHRSLETGDPEVMVRFAGFGAEEDEWVNVRKNVRQRSLPCEASECVAVLPSDLILCFQEGKEQALYFDAHVLDAQRRRHDVRGCRCRFLVRYDHDQSEEIVALRKICRRPETDYRLQQLHAINESLSVKQNKNGANNNVHTVSTLRVYPPAEVQPKQNSVVPPPVAESPQKRQRLDSTVPPEGPHVEPVMLADVSQNQQRVQPAVSTPSAQPLVEPPKLEGVVPSPSTQASVELVGTRSDEVALELQKVHEMPDPSTEVSVDTHKGDTEVPSSGEATQEQPTVVTNVVSPLPGTSEELHKTEPVTSGEKPQETQAVGPTVTPSAEIEVEAPVESHVQDEPQKEPVISSSSLEVIADLHEVQPAVLDQTQSTAAAEVAMDTKTEEPVVSVNDPNVVKASEETKTEEPVVSANDANVVEESVETKTEEPVVPTNDPSLVEETIKNITEESVVPVNDHNMIEAEIEKPHLIETMEEKHEAVSEKVSEDKVENSDLAPENAAVAMEEG